MVDVHFFRSQSTSSKRGFLGTGYGTVRCVPTLPLMCNDGRIQLLEEGQTKDLTIMVGHRLEEGASSQEVMQLR